ARGGWPGGRDRHLRRAGSASGCGPRRPAPRRAPAPGRSPRCPPTARPAAPPLARPGGGPSPPATVPAAARRRPVRERRVGVVMEARAAPSRLVL
ncbi:MAG: hypothetical protein FJ125_02620, partial [Deltaproteobacteria bacterium]|nr:hypothetical protein [Deltaproteobacteria bacterium]